jgi:hypothetical protein
MRNFRSRRADCNNTLEVSHSAGWRWAMGVAKGYLFGLSHLDPGRGLPPSHRTGDGYLTR